MVTAAHLDGWKLWFKGYVSEFLTVDKDFCNIMLMKYDHTLRVCEEIRTIGDSLNLSEEEQNIAETIALFHDLGRFDQYRRYRTFADGKSFNHAELSTAIIQEQSLLQQLGAQSRDIICTAILDHNTVKIPSRGHPASLFFTQLIRDADKLDIYRIVIGTQGRGNESVRFPVNLELPDSDDISPEVIRAVMNRRLVDSHHVRNLTDFKLLQIGWIFDINFDHTFNEIASRGYLNLIFGTLPDTDLMRGIRETVMDTLYRKIKYASHEKHPAAETMP